MGAYCTIIGGDGHGLSNGANKGDQQSIGRGTKETCLTHSIEGHDNLNTAEITEYRGLTISSSSNAKYNVFKYKWGLN